MLLRKIQKEESSDGRQTGQIEDRDPEPSARQRRQNQIPVACRLDEHENQIKNAAESKLNVSLLQGIKMLGGFFRGNIIEAGRQNRSCKEQETDPGKAALISAGGRQNDTEDGEERAEDLEPCRFFSQDQPSGVTGGQIHDAENNEDDSQDDGNEHQGPFQDKF